MLILLLIGAFALLFISAALAPLESLKWWAGWSGDTEATAEAVRSMDTLPQSAAAARQANHYLVYLSGIGAISGVSVPEEEIRLLDTLEIALPDSVVVRDVFPYSVTNSGLNGQRSFAGMWRWLEQRRLKNPMAISQLLINLRNMFQVAVSADSRYGPVYNLGVAQEILRGLLRAGYPVQEHKPVTIIGWSGGGQVALGASLYLETMIRAPITIISIGGVLSNDPGIRSIKFLSHNYGSKDPVQRVGEYLYPGRWPSSVASAWNVAKAQGKISMTELGPFTHMGKGNYFDWDAKLPDGRSHAGITLNVIVTTVQGAQSPSLSGQQTVAAQTPADSQAK